MKATDSFEKRYKKVAVRAIILGAVIGLAVSIGIRIHDNFWGGWSNIEFKQIAGSPANDLNSDLTSWSMYGGSSWSMYGGSSFDTIFQPAVAPATGEIDWALALTGCFLGSATVEWQITINGNEINRGTLRKHWWLPWGVPTDNVQVSRVTDVREIRVSARRTDHRDCSTKLGISNFGLASRNK